MTDTTHGDAMDDDGLMAVRDAILEEVLANVAFDGWTDRSLRDAVRMTETDPAHPGRPGASS